MAYIDNVRSAVQLTGIGRAAFEAVYNDSVLATYFPLVEKPTTTFELVQSLGASDEVATKLTHYNTTAPRGDAAPVGRVLHGRVARTSEANLVDEINLITAPTNDQLGGWLEDRARDLGRRIANRLRLMTGEVLATGKVDVREAGVADVINFNRPSKNSVTRNSTDAWTDPASNPLEDAIVWRELAGGSDTLLVPQAIFTALRKNKNLIAQAGATTPSISAADVEMLFAAEGFNLVVVDGINNNVRAYDGKSKTVLPTDSVILLPGAGTSVLGAGDGGVGYVHLAPTVESGNTKYGISAAERPGLFVAAFHEEDPEGFAVRAAAEMLPLLKAPAATVVAKMAG